MRDEKTCPMCGEVILAIAKKCKHCGSWLNETSLINEPITNTAAPSAFVEEARMEEQRVSAPNVAASTTNNLSDDNPSKVRRNTITTKARQGDDRPSETNRYLPAIGGLLTLVVACCVAWVSVDTFEIPSPSPFGHIPPPEFFQLARKDVSVMAADTGASTLAKPEGDQPYPESMASLKGAQGTGKNVAENRALAVLLAQLEKVREVMADRRVTESPTTLEMEASARASKEAAAIGMAHEMDTITPPHELRPDIPRQVSALVMQMKANSVMRAALRAFVGSDTGNTAIRNATCYKLLGGGPTPLAADKAELAKLWCQRLRNDSRLGIDTSWVTDELDAILMLPRQRAKP